MNAKRAPCPATVTQSTFPCQLLTSSPGRPAGLFVRTGTTPRLASPDPAWSSPGSVTGPRAPSTGPAVTRQAVSAISAVSCGRGGPTGPSYQPIVRAKCPFLEHSFVSEATIHQGGSHEVH